MDHRAGADERVRRARASSFVLLVRNGLAAAPTILHAMGSVNIVQPTAVRLALIVLRRSCLLLCALFAYLASTSLPSLRADVALTLPEQLRALVAKAALGPRVSLTVIDTSTGQTLFAHNAKTPLNPASNLKLLTAATAMIELGPEYRTRTALYGRMHDGILDGDLCLKGQADPTLTRADLGVFAQRILDEGVREIAGVTIDGSYFDGSYLPPAFEQQPNEVAPFRAAIAALSINGNAYTLRVRPGPSEGAPAFASVDGAGYFEIDNGLTTAGAQLTPNIVATEKDLGDRIALSLRGTLPLGTASLAYQRRVSAPLPYAGYVFIEALRVAGIKVAPRVTIGTCRSDAPLIALRTSPPLAEMLTRLGKDSDNFVAEMLLKTLGAEKRRTPGTSADGVAVVQDTIRRLGLPGEALTMINGSGLFQGNRVTTELLAQLLTTLFRNSSYRADFVSHLAVGGVDGTLARRFRNLPASRIVRAKTGTLDDVIALSGYVLGPTPERVIAFSFLANGVSGKHNQARELSDHVVEAIAGQLYGH
jgi:D-alanyl-D-alanine carboxypeptidase/D-alanyl-D-alanine-endopeptidase (penicillin-binding protein 4)